MPACIVEQADFSSKTCQWEKLTLEHTLHSIGAKQVSNLREAFKGFTVLSTIEVLVATEDLGILIQHIYSIRSTAGISLPQNHALQHCISALKVVNLDPQAVSQSLMLLDYESVHHSRPFRSMGVSFESITSWQPTRKEATALASPPKSSEAEDLGGWEWEVRSFSCYMAFANAEFKSSTWVIKTWLPFCTPKAHLQFPSHTLAGSP